LRRFCCSASRRSSRSSRKAAEGCSCWRSLRPSKSLSNDFSSCFFMIIKNEFF
jgi:hypothetical protein